MTTTINASLSSGLVQTADTSGILQLQTGGTTALTVDASQNVGIGVTPSAWSSYYRPLQAGTNGAFAGGNDDSVFTSNAYYDGNWKYITTGVAATRFRQTGGTFTWSNAASGTAGNAITFAESARIDSSGNLLVGNTSLWSSEKLGITGSSASQRFLYARTTANGQYLSLGTNGTLPYVEFGNGAGLAFNDGATERARIDSSGNLLVGTTSAAGSASTFKSTVGAGQQAVSFWNNATAGTRYFVTFGTEASYTERGFITWNGSTTALSNASDSRLKENIVDAPSALQKVADIQIRSFDFKEDGRHVEYGVIAQELIDVVPAAVFEGSDNADGSINRAWSVGLEPIIPLLVKAIQEQQALITQQAEAITALTTRITALEGAAA